MYEHLGPGGPETLARPPAEYQRYGVPAGRPSGLFPAGPRRPTYREPHPVRGAAIAAGLAGGAAWLLLFGLLGQSLRGYVWWTVVAGLIAWLVALLLVKHGDRGVAVGVTIATALGLSIAATAVTVRWMVTATWPLW